MVGQLRAAGKIIGVSEWKSQGMEIALKTRFRIWLLNRCEYYGIGFLKRPNHKFCLQSNNRILKDLGLLEEAVVDSSAEICLREVLGLIPG